MFYDERIEAIRGKLSKNALVISTLFALVYGVLRLINILLNANSNRHLVLVAVEAVITLGGGAILLIGWLRRLSAERDERFWREEAAYYTKAAFVLLGVTLGVFALLLPYTTLLSSTYLFVDAGFGSILASLFFIVGAYAVYSFRRQDVYFNYSLMEGRYYRGVFKNIGKLALCFLGYCSLSIVAVILLAVTVPLSNSKAFSLFWDISLSYFTMLVLLSLLYLFYSLLEKESYQSERLLSSASLVSLMITVGIYTLYLILSCLLTALPISNPLATSITVFTSRLLLPLRAAFLIFFAYFAYEYQKKTPSKLMSSALLTVFLTSMITQGAGQLINAVTFIFVPTLLEGTASVTLGQLLSNTNVALSTISELGYAAGLILALIALIKHRYIKTGNFAAIGVYALLYGIKLFLNTQADAFILRVYQSAVALAALVYLSVLLLIIAQRERQSCGLSLGLKCSTKASLVQREVPRNEAEGL